MHLLFDPLYSSTVTYKWDVIVKVYLIVSVEMLIKN